MKTRKYWILLSTLFFAASWLFVTLWSSPQSQEMFAAKPPPFEKGIQTATFAGGCYWCMEAAFEKLDGPAEVVSGYAAGVFPGKEAELTGEIEAIRVRYNPTVISYSELLDHYWRQFDPTDKGGSFYDRGPKYESYIFFHNDRQQNLAEDSKEALDNSGLFDKPVVTEIVKFHDFTLVEESEQDFYKKNPERYHSYREASGRDDFIEKIWGNIYMKTYKKPGEDELRKKLTDLQYDVTQNNATERPFTNKYVDNKREGIYVDIVSGEPLYSSTHKFKSGTGWPSFTRPIDPFYMKREIDRSLGMERIEVRSRYADSHLGHVFTDGIAPTYLRHCINSAALKFIPREDMEADGYGHLNWLFQLKK